MNKKISIVMAYRNRKSQLLKTLQSIAKSIQKNIEIIIVDDCSSEEHRISDISNEFNMPIKVIEFQNKWWKNPCVSFNIGFKETKGDIIVIQNPECEHVNDVLDYIVKHINDKTYLCFACLALGKKNKMSSINDKTFKSRITNGNIWYCHNKFRSWAPHFTAAITRKNLVEKLGGFDERYAKEYFYDDLEFYQRVKRLGLNIITPDPVLYPYVIHQYHPNTNPKIESEINYKLYHNITLKEKGYKVN